MPHPSGQLHVDGVTASLACMRRVLAVENGKIARETESVYSFLVMEPLECRSVVHH